ncbi:MAG: hypothetical protein KUG77_28660 [Nannocystaceae bacterium]|nr:hypothetical protein [Nannocystaceae bacterium]
MRYAAGLLVLGLVAALSGCVERLIQGEDTDAMTSTSQGDDSSSSEDVFNTEGAECNGPQECPEGATCFEGVCVGTGELRVSLSWNYVSDLDLYVQTPAGDIVSFETPELGGGILDVDDCVGGECLDNGMTHVENIYFPMQPPVGEYRVWVNNFDGARGGPFEIQVSGEGSATFTGTLPASAVESQVFAFGI